MGWQEEMRMGMKLIKDACDRSEKEQGKSCDGCPFTFSCNGGPEYPAKWEYDANGDEL